MRLKSFYAKTMTEAMHMVRQTLGEDAVIVATREESGGKSVRVTAAIDPEDRYGEDRFTRQDDIREPNFEVETVPVPAQSEQWLQYDREDEEGAVTEKLTDVMLRHGATDEITDQILSCATILGHEDAAHSLVAALEHLYSFRALPIKPTSTAIMLVGPPGAGKTLGVAKLAARSVMRGLRVGVISTDTIRAGGIEQLSAFTKLMHVTLQKASSPKQLREALDKMQAVDQVFIDTGGMNPFEAEEMRDLARLISAGDIEPILTMPAGLDPDESGEIARVYATLGVRSVLPTRLDIARRLGGILGAAHHGGLIFADASNTPKVADGLIALTPQALTALLMPEATRKKSQTARRSRAG